MFLSMLSSSLDNWTFETAFMSDEFFLNLWICDLPSKLVHLSGLPWHVLPVHFQTTLMIRMVTSFLWKGYYFSFCSLPFGWKESTCYLYHNLGFVITSAAWPLGVPLLQCNYYRWQIGGPVFLSGLTSLQPSSQSARRPHVTKQLLQG